MMTTKLPTYEHYLSIDYGSKFIGLASYRPQTDPMIIGLGRLENLGDREVFKYLKQLIVQEEIDCCLVGIPYMLDGRATTATKKMQDFLKKCQQELPIPIIEVDETLTSFEAESRMLQDPAYNFQVDLKRIDEMSAKIILESYLREQKILK